MAASWRGCGNWMMVLFEFRFGYGLKAGGGCWFSDGCWFSRG